jgi:hypothetical protein
VVGLREDGAAISRSGADETQLTSRQVAMRRAHEEDPGSSVVVFEADSASVSSFIVRVRGREVKHRITASASLKKHTQQLSAAVQQKLNRIQPCTPHYSQ